MNRITFAAALLAAALPAAARAAQDCHSGFVVVPSPNVSTQNDSDLSSVAGRSTDDVWAVGQFAPDSNPNITQTLAEHFDGVRWSIVPTPNVGKQGNALLHVTALRNGQAWAVGYHIDDRTFWSRSLIEYFDGVRWRIVDHPELGQSAQLFGVYGTDEYDVWAVGSYQQPLGRLHTLIEHYDGTAWRVVPSPDPGATGNILYSVSGAGDRAVAVGNAAGRASPSSALVLRWDGYHWTQQHTPSSGTANLSLYGVALDARGNALAAGESEDDVPGIGTSGLAFALHGGEAERQRVRHVGAGDNHFYGLAVPPFGPAWAVGGRFDPASGTVKTLIERLDDPAEGWTPVPSPSPNPADDNILGGVAVIGDDVWAVGVGPNQNARQTLILHRCLANQAAGN